MSQVAGFFEGNRIVIKGELFGTDPSVVSVELFSTGIMFDNVVLLSCRENEIVVDALVDTSTGVTFNSVSVSATVQAVSHPNS